MLLFLHKYTKLCTLFLVPFVNKQIIIITKSSYLINISFIYPVHHGRVTCLNGWYNQWESILKNQHLGNFSEYFRNNWYADYTIKLKKWKFLSERPWLEN